MVVTARNGVPEERNLYRIVCTLSPEIRRRVFLVLVGELVGFVVEADVEGGLLRVLAILDNGHGGLDWKP